MMYFRSIVHPGIEIIMYKKFIAFLFILTIFVNVIMAQSKEEKAVAAAVETLRKAMIDGDKQALETIAADQLSYGHSSGNVEDKKTFVTTLTSGKSDFVTIDLTNQTITVSGETAIVRHKLDATTNDNGQPGTVSLSILTVWQKQKGKWVMLARQAVKQAAPKS